MAIIDLVRWAPQGNETIYAYNLSSINNYNGFEFISLSKQLIVSNL
jgi:hypothetical protein